MHYIQLTDISAKWVARQTFSEAPQHRQLQYKQLQLPLAQMAVKPGESRSWYGCMGFLPNPLYDASGDEIRFAGGIEALKKSARKLDIKELETAQRFFLDTSLSRAFASRRLSDLPNDAFVSDLINDETDGGLVGLPAFLKHHRITNAEQFNNKIPIGAIVTQIVAQVEYWRSLVAAKAMEAGTTLKLPDYVDELFRLHEVISHALRSRGGYRSKRIWFVGSGEGTPCVEERGSSHVGGSDEKVGEAPRPPRAPRTTAGRRLVRHV